MDNESWTADSYSAPSYYQDAVEEKDLMENRIETTFACFPATVKAKEVYGVDLNRNPIYVVLDLGCTRSMGSRKAITVFARVAPQHGIWLEYKPCKTNFISADSETDTVRETCVVHLPTTPPCTTQIFSKRDRFRC